MSKELAADLQKQEVNTGYLEFYELEIGSGSNNILYFHAGRNENSANITYDGNTYLALPILLSDIEVSSSGAMSRPTLTIANVESLIKNQSVFKTQMEDGTWDAVVDGEELTYTDFRIDDLVGSKLIRRRTLEKYLTSNPTVEFNKDTYIIDRIQSKNNVFVTLELSSPIDLAGIRIPTRDVIGKYCPWRYQGAAAGLTEKRGACHWKTHNQFVAADGTASSVFVTVDDEPLFKVVPSGYSGSGGILSAGSGSIGDATFLWVYSYNTSNNSGGGRASLTATTPTYQENYIVLEPVAGVAGNARVAYISKMDSNAGPLNDPVYWVRCRLYTVWSDAPSNTQFTINTDDIRENSYVLHNNTVWRATKAHTKNSSYEPGEAPSHWVRGDVCGKLLNSCKLRYQAQKLHTATTTPVMSTGVGFNFLTSASLNTAVPLPFGGFPGSRKFR